MHAGIENWHTLPLELRMHDPGHRVDTVTAHTGAGESHMSTALSSLAKLFSHRREHAALPDAADMGTCFGMEMTLQPSAERPLESEQRAVAATAASEAGRRWRPWPTRSSPKPPPLTA